MLGNSLGNLLDFIYKEIEVQKHVMLARNCLVFLKNKTDQNPKNSFQSCFEHLPVGIQKDRPLHGPQRVRSQSVDIDIVSVVARGSTAGRSRRLLPLE